MRKKKKGPLIAAVVLALVATILFNNYIQRLQKKNQELALKATTAQGQAQTPQNLDTKKVLVAKIDIPVNALIEPPMLEEKDWPKDMLPEDVFTMKEKDELLDKKVAKLNILKGELLRREKITRLVNASNLSHSIPPGFRALTLEVDKVKSVAGFVRQGDYVDIVASSRVNGKMITKTMLQNVRILAIDHNFSSEPVLEIDPNTKQKKVAHGMVPKLVTLAVPLWAVEKILAVEKAGGKDGLRLVLKPYKDGPHENDKGEQKSGTLVQTTGFSENELFALNKPEEATNTDVKSEDKAITSTVQKSLITIHRKGESRTVILNE